MVSIMHPATPVAGPDPHLQAKACSNKAAVRAASRAALEPANLVQSSAAPVSLVADLSIQLAQSCVRDRFREMRVPGHALDRQVLHPDHGRLGCQRRTQVVMMIGPPVSHLTVVALSCRVLRSC